MFGKALSVPDHRRLAIVRGGIDWKLDQRRRHLRNQPGAAGRVGRVNIDHGRPAIEPFEQWAKLRIAEISARRSCSASRRHARHRDASARSASRIAPRDIGHRQRSEKIEAARVSLRPARRRNRCIAGASSRAWPSSPKWTPGDEIDSTARLTRASSIAASEASGVQAMTAATPVANLSIQPWPAACRTAEESDGARQSPRWRSLLAGAAARPAPANASVAVAPPSTRPARTRQGLGTFPAPALGRDKRVIALPA